MQRDCACPSNLESNSIVLRYLFHVKEDKPSDKSQNQLKMYTQGIVVHTYNPSSQEHEAGGLPS